MSEHSSFPKEVLEQSSFAKLSYFQKITVPHRHLKTALDQLLRNIQVPTDISLFFIVGPTGVGKTTLRLRAEKLLLEQALPELIKNPGFIATAGMEALPATQGKFSHRDYYIRALESVGEVLINYKSSYGIETGLDEIHTTKRTAALRRSLENVFHHRQIQTFMIDEAHHLLMMAGAHQMLQQMNWIKSIANITKTIHVLFGTYELLNCSRLSGQLSRRSLDIHLPRYQCDVQSDVIEFIKVIQTFQRHLPLRQEPSLDKHYEYLMDYSIGCIGILNTWLSRALRDAVLDDAKTITLKNLQRNQYSASRRQQLKEEVEVGERRLDDLGYSDCHHNDPPSSKVHSSQTKGRVGERKPKRDPVGTHPHET